MVTVNGVKKRYGVFMTFLNHKNEAALRTTALRANNESIQGKTFCIVNNPVP
jgi:hypothetical protein